MAQGMDAEFFMLPRQAALGFGDLDGLPDAGLAHRFRAVMQGLAQRHAAALPATSGAGEQPLGVAVRLPELAQAVEQLGRDRHFALLAAFTFGDANDQTFAIDVSRLDVQSFAHTQATLVDNGEVSAVATVAEGAQQSGDFVAGEHMRQRLLTENLDFLPDVPIAIEVIAIKGAQSAHRLIECAALELAFILQVNQEIENLGFAETRNLSCRVVRRELPDPAEVAALRALAQSFELDKALVVAIPFE